ncbi:MAG: hypothetical protein R2851_06980 [Caldilineaceae bacterium]
MQATSMPEMTQDESHWALRQGRRLVDRRRPYLGWLVLVLTMLIATLPALALDVHDWLRAARLSGAVRTVGPVAVLVMWLALGWRRPRDVRWRWWQTLLLYAGLMLLGALLLSQLFLRWIPGPAALVAAARTDGWPALTERIAAQWTAFGARYVLWWQGVQAGGAAQDDVIFAGGAGLLAWFTGLVTAWLVYRRRHAFTAALLPLWLTINLLVLAQQGRYVLLVGLVAVLTLHLLLDHGNLIGRWQAHGWDFAPDVIVDRAVAVAGVTLMLLALGLFMPNVAVRPISDWYYGLIAPVDTQVDALTERLFPEYERTSRRGLGTVAGGLPNEFLLRGGPDLGRQLVMRVRTSDVVSDSPYEEAPRHRATTCVGPPTPSTTAAAGTTVRPMRAHRSPPTPGGPRRIGPGAGWWCRACSWPLSAASSTAPEPVEPSLDYRVQQRSPDDLVALLRAHGRLHRGVAGLAVSEEQLAAAVAWTPPPDGADPWPSNWPCPTPSRSGHARWPPS